MPTLGSVAPVASVVRPVRAGSGSGLGQGLLALSKGLGGLASAFEEQAETQRALGDSEVTIQLAHKQRREALERSSAMVDFAKLQGQWSRDAITLETEAPLGDPDFEMRVGGELDTRLDTFIEGLPEHLKESMTPAIETYRQNQKTDLFGKQLTIEGKKYSADLADLNTQIQDSIFTGQRRMEDWLPVIDEYFTNSPFPAEVTETMKKEMLKQIQTLQFTIDGTEELKNPTATRGTVGELPAGMPPEAMGLLNSIIGVESGGKYNVIHGGGTFSDYSKHPGIYVEIKEGPNAGGKSSAAGIGQFIESTWNGIAEKYGLEDFSPANQLRGMWLLAQDDYRSRTGRDLLTDLRSKDPIVLSAIRRSLVPTWEGLGNKDDQTFVNDILGGKGTFPSVMDDPAFTELSQIERAGLMETMLKNAQEEQTAQLKAQQEALARQTELFTQAIASGQITSAEDINRYAQQNNLSLAETEKLHETRNKYQTGRVETEGFIAGLAQPGHVFTDADKRGFNNLFVQEGAKAFQEQDYGYVQNVLLPNAKAAGFLPVSAIDMLGAMRQSADPNQARFAYSTMAAIESQDTRLFEASFDKATIADSVYYRQMAPYMPEQQRLEQIKLQNSPEWKRVVEALEPAYKEVIKDHAEDFTPAALADEFDADSFDGIAGAQITADFSELYRTEFFKYQNHKLAKEAAIKILGQTWGTYDSGSGAHLMRLPPQLTGLQPIAGSYSWVNDIAREDMGLTPEDKFQLLSDAQSDAELKAGKPVSYKVAVEVLPGLFLPKLGADNLPLRTAFSDPQKMKELTVESNIWYHNFKSLENTQRSALANVRLFGQPAEASALILSGQLGEALLGKKPSVAKGLQTIPMDDVAGDWKSEELRRIALKGFGLEGASPDKLQDIFRDYPLEDIVELFDESVLAPEEQQQLRDFILQVQGVK